MKQRQDSMLLWSRWKKTRRILMVSYRRRIMK